MSVAVALVAATLTLAVRTEAQAATGDGSPTDPNIAFTGRWDTRTATAFVPGWAGAYLRTGFTGTTVKLKQRNAIDLYYSIDGAADTFIQNVSGTVNLTPAPLRAGNHTLRVSYRVVAGSYHGDAVFQGLILDSGARTLPLAVPTRLVEFIGDSITVGQLSSKVALTAYGWLVGERLGVRHTQIAQGGACLVATTAGCLGMNTQFLRLNSAPTAPNWDFGRYQANVVVINLGANDSVSSTQFQDGYVTLLRNARAKYPAATIIALRNLKGRFAAPTQAAVNTLVAGGDTRVVFVNTDGWITSADTVDGLHPNDTGHLKVADRLTPIVAGFLG
jgi:lysophospholipase L1-like esterase